MSGRFEESRRRAWEQIDKNLTVYTTENVAASQRAIEYLIDHDYFVPLTKEQFAIKMGWITGKPPNEKPNRRLVEQVCNLTRDVESAPEGYPDWVVAAMGGYVIGYAPNTGGLSLRGEGVDIDDRDFIHFLVGDLQAQQATKTRIRRRLPTWKKVAQAFANAGETDMARLLFQGEDQIAKHGMVDDHTVGEIHKTARIGGYIA